MGCVPPLLSFLLMVVSGWVYRHRLIAIEYLQAEKRLLKERLRGKRIRFTDAGSFVRSIRKECLSRMIFVGQASLCRAASEFMEHSREERNYQGLENRLIRGQPAAVDSIGIVQRRPRLGGILNFCYRKAA